MNQYRIFRRRGGVYYIHDSVTGKQQSLRTKLKKEAERVLHAKQEAKVQPSINRQIARAYLHAADENYVKRTWADVMAAIIATKTGTTGERWETASRDTAYDLIRNRVVTETPSEIFLEVMRRGGVSTNIFLRRIHNFAVGMDFLLSPVIPRRAWPSYRHKPKRAITRDEHERIIAAEVNRERRLFYESCWHLGASQGDIARLHAEDINWSGRVINFDRSKTRWRGQQPPQVRIGRTFEAVLRDLPDSGPLFPYLSGSAPVIAPPSLDRGASNSASKARASTATDTLGPSALKSLATQSATRC